MSSQTAVLPAPAFTFFHRLPPEIRLQIWSYTLELAFVNIRWNPTQRVFKSARKPPALLHVNSESRAYGLKHYTLSFASSPDFARVYFNFDLDVLYVEWPSLGPAPGRIGRKMGDEEMGKVHQLLISEGFLLRHAQEEMRELARFTNLKGIAVICDKSRPESGSHYGAGEIWEFGEDLRPGEEKWPALMCLRDGEEAEEEVCSRHWWFDGWNQRAGVCWERKWQDAVSDCLHMTLWDDVSDTDSYDSAEDDVMDAFFLSVLLGHEVASQDVDGEDL